VILKDLPRRPEAIGSRRCTAADQWRGARDQRRDRDHGTVCRHRAGTQPPYIAAMRAFAAKMPGNAAGAAFETAFHQTIPMSRQVYGIPHEWTEKLGIRDTASMAHRIAILRRA